MESDGLSMGAAATGSRRMAAARGCQGRGRDPRQERSLSWTSTLTRNTRRRLVIGAVLIVFGAVIGPLYALRVGGDPFYAVIVGAAITGGIAAFELFYVQLPAGAWLRRLPLLQFIAVSTLCWTLIIALCAQGLPLLLGAPPGRYAPGQRLAALTQDTVFSLVVAFFMNMTLRLRSLVGGRVLLNFLSGRYRHPLEEQRIILFLDLVGSTTIAERIGHVRYHAFLNAFVADLEDPVFAHGGEIYQYVGDEVVVTWPIADARANARCVACHFAIVEAVSRSRARYEAAFGAVPAFRTGIHCGPVVVGEIGVQRKQIVFVGDVVNTASRMEAEARTRNRNLVVSGTLLSLIDLPAGIEARSLGVVQPRGKAAAIDLFELVRSAAA